MFEDCWLAGLDERAWLIMAGYERANAARMVELRRQADEVLREARKVERIQVKAARVRQVRRQRRYQTTKRALCWMGWMVSPRLVRRPRRRMR